MVFILGIVGGVASGKSAVARLLAAKGAVVLDADAQGHAVLREAEVIEAFQKRWGSEVLDDAGQIVRREVARRVFGDSPEAERERDFLNRVTHPRIRARLREQLEDLQKGDVSLAVIDAALLYETGWNELCHAVAFVAAPREVRLERALARGWTAEQFAAREASQWPIAEKQSRARWVIENSGSLAELEPQIEKIMQEANRHA